MFSRKNLPLLVALAIPVLMTILIAVSIYVPSLFIKPGFNFLYITGNTYGYQNLYTVKNSRLTKNDLPQSSYPELYSDLDQHQLYEYNVKRNKNIPVSFEEAQNFILDPSTESPDGFEITRDTSYGGVFSLFFGIGNSNYDARYIKGSNIAKKLNLKSLGGSYYDNFHFLGWIKE